MNKKIIFVVCFLATFLSFSAAHAAVTVSVGNASGAPGSTVAVPINISDTTGQGIIAMDIHINYSTTVLTYASLKLTGPMSTGWNYAANPNYRQPGTLAISLFTTTGMAGYGNIIVLNFNVKPNAPIGASPIVLVQARCNDGKPASNLQPGIFKVTPAGEPQTPEPTPAPNQATDNTDTSNTDNTSNKQPIVTNPIIAFPMAPQNNAPEPQTIQQPLAPPQANYPARDMNANPEEIVQQNALQPRVLAPRDPEFKIGSQASNPPISHVTRSTAGEPQATALPPTPPLQVTAKTTNRLLLWRAYRLETTPSVPVKSWKLVKNERLPYWLKLDRKSGEIKGLVWGAKEVQLKLRVTNTSGEAQEVACRLNTK